MCYTHSCGLMLRRLMGSTPTKWVLLSVTDAGRIVPKAHSTVCPLLIPLILLLNGVLSCIVTDCNICPCTPPGRGQFDLCRICYETGDGCGDKSHTLTEFAVFWENSPALLSAVKFVPYCDGPRCGKVFEAGDVAYACFDCPSFVTSRSQGLNGLLNVCYSCYITGVGCKNREHKLHRRTYRE